MLPGFMIFLSLFLLALSYAIARRKAGGQALRWAVALATVVVLLLAVFYFVADYFTGKGVDESVIYHLSYGLEGAGFGEYKVLIAASIVLIVLSIGVAVCVFVRLPRRSGRPSKRWTWVSAALALAAVGVSPASTELARLFFQQWTGAHGGARFRYVRPTVEPAKTPLNVVFLYLESFERTYLDERLFPGLVPGLKELEKQGTSYNDIRQVYGTGWTVAGITASACGVPLVTASAGNEALGNSMSGLAEFLPGALCMGDILAEQGYSLDYLGGASLDFAGKGNFFRTHGFQKVQGFRELAGKAGNPAYKSAWGLYDDTIFDLAVDRFAELAAMDRPFGLFLLTLGTHHPRGHVSARCGGIKYGAGDNPMLNAARCTDLLVADYVERIRKADSEGNTLIVIASDHLAMVNTASGLLRKGDRKNLLLVLPPGGGPSKVVGRAGSTLDIAPTILSTMGFDVDGLGLGRDLARSASTIVESLPDVNGFLASQSGYLSGLWEFPQLDQGVSIDPSLREARLGGSSIKLPAMLLVSPEAEVKEIRFEFHTPTKNLIDHLGELPPSQSVVWLDACPRIDIVDTKNRIAPGSAGLCIAVGRMDSEDFHVNPINGQIFYDQDTLKGWLAAEVDPRALSMRRERVRNYRRIGSPQLSSLRVFPDRDLGGDVVIVVSGGPGPSFAGKPGATSAQGLKLSRGLTLLGMRDGETVKLAHYDSCDPARPVRDSASSPSPFIDHIDEAKKEGYSTFLILGHDSVRCRAVVDLGRMFAGLPLGKWKNIGYRQPYVGVIGAGLGGWEQIGSTGAPMALHLTEFSATPGTAKTPGNQ